jgi:branched-chain amino acid transport system permease protein
MGISRIHPPSFFGFPIFRKGEWVLLAMITLCFFLVLVRLLERSSLRSALIGVGEEPEYMESLGFDVNRIRIAVFCLGGGLAAIPGSYYAHYVSYIDPSLYGIQESMLLLSVLFIGGVGNAYGCLWASSLLVGLPEILRFFGGGWAGIGNLRQIVFGLLLAAVASYSSKRSR